MPVTAMYFCLLRFSLATILAHLGSARAQYVLASAYYDGRCVQRNPVKAAAWCTKAAKRGVTRAQVLLSNFNIAGYGVPQDYASALLLAEQAAKHEDPRGWHALAWFYEQGVSTSVDKGHAFALWLKAAETGYGPSQYAVAHCFFNGSGTTKNLRAARDWCELAIENDCGEPEATSLRKAIHQALGNSEAMSAPRHGSSMTQVSELIASKRPRQSLLSAWPKVLSATLRHRFGGGDIQTYHLSQSRNFEQAGDYSRVAYHARQLLDMAEHAETRARLAHAYSMLRKDADAVREYRKAVAEWDHPAIVLGLAQAEFRSGNKDTATELLKDVQGSYLGHYLRHAVAELKAEMG